MRWWLALVLIGCTAPSDSPDLTSSPLDLATAALTDGDVSPSPDLSGGCFISTTGESGDCLTTSACAAMSGYMSFAGYCPGPSDIQCCALTPSVSDNPAVPPGWKLMQQSEVTADMTAWAVMILHDPVGYPMFSTTTRTFGTLVVMARVEWHPPDFQNSAVHRGVTLYEPA